MKAFFILLSLFQKSVAGKYFLLLYKKNPIFLWAMSYYIALYFVNSNLSFLIVSMLFFLVLYSALRSFSQATYLMFVASLPLAKGKTFEMILIPKGQMPYLEYSDIGYIFPLYPSFVFLVIMFYIFFRKGMIKSALFRLSGALYGYFVFLFISLIPVLYTPFPVIVGLSGVQLLFMGGIYVLPRCLQSMRSSLRHISHVLAAFVIFEGGWVLAQALYHGHLGRYIEAVLITNRVGILSTEDSGLLRFNGTFFEPSILGTFMLMHLFYFGSLLMHNMYKTSSERMIYIVAMISAFISIILTGSRGVYALFFVLLFVVWRAPIIKVIKQVVTASFSRRIVLVILMILLISSPYLMKRLQTVPALFVSPLEGRGSGGYRLILNSLAFNIGTTHVFGVGLNLSPYYFVRGLPSLRINEPAHPHNIFFQILAETGFPGLIAFILFLWLVIRKFIMKPFVKAEPYFIASIIYILAAQIYPIFISQPEICSFFFLHAGLMNWIVDRNRV
jgi:O-Antigen ligase